jgi:oligoendopeptidase F
MTDLLHQRGSTEFPRAFVAPDADFGSWDGIKPYFEKLRAWDITDRNEAGKWLLALSELQAAIGEEHTVRYIQMTCHTDDPELEKGYLFYLQEILPRTEPEFFELSRKYLASPAREELPRDRYFVYDRARKNEVEIFREENVPIHTEDDVLAQQYQKVFGEMTVEFDGREQTLPQMHRYLEETDRDRRREAWLGIARRVIRDRDRVE